MAEIIKARVWTKIDTLENWNANPLILGPGEFAPVLTAPGGSVFNFKVGTGDRRFSDLPWSLQTPGAAQEANTSTVFPTGVPGLYIPTESGTYNGITVDLSAGYTQLIWDGATLVDVVFPIDLSSYTLTSDFLPVKEKVDDAIVTSKNIANKSDIIPNSYYTSSGNIASHATYRRLPLIAVLPNTQYTISGAYSGFIGCEFNNSEVFVRVIASPISGQPVTEITFTTSATTYFLGVNVAYGDDSSDYDDTIMVNQGDKIDYEPFGYIPNVAPLGVAYQSQLTPINDDLTMIIGDFYDRYSVFNGTAKAPLGQSINIGANGDYVEFVARINGGSGSADWLGVLGVNGTVANTIGFFNKTSVWLKGQTPAESYVQFNNVVPVDNDFTNFHKVRIDVVGTDFQLSIDDEVKATLPIISQITINTIADAYNSATVFSQVDIQYVTLHTSSVDLTITDFASLPGAVNVTAGMSPKSGSPASASSASEIMEVKKTADTFEIYMHQKDDVYIKQIFRRYTKAYESGEISFYDVWKLGGMYRAVRNAAYDYTEGAMYVTEGTEWETAVQVDGNHISGNQHGYEQKTSVIFLIDGVLLSEGSTGNFRCKKIEVIEKAQLYRFNTTTNPIIDKTTKWTIENGRITIEFPEFKFLEDVEITYRCYLGMASVVRSGVTQTGFNDVSYYINDLESISTDPDLSVGVQNVNPNTNRLWLQGAQLGFEMEVLHVDDVKPTRQLIVHNTTNKLYHIYCGIYSATTGENFSAIVSYNFATT